MNKTRSKNIKVVVKFGTENLFGDNNTLDQKVFDDFARQIVLVQALDIHPVVVSSGAIKAGMERLLSLGINPQEFTKKELAGIGARHLLNMWGRAFEKYGKEVGQVLVTFANWEEPNELQSIKTSILNYCRLGIIPIINENDVVSDAEIKLMERGISENDRLARMVTELINADGVLFLTNVAGIFEEDPRKNSNAKMYAEVDRRTVNDHVSIDAANISPNGTGGMAAKLKEAVICSRSERYVVIAGREKDVILKFVQHKPVGTRVGKMMRLF